MKTIEEIWYTEEDVDNFIENHIGAGTALGDCLSWVMDDAHGNTNAYEIATKAAAELASQTAVIEAARPFSVLPENGKTIINLNVKFVEKLAAALAALDKVNGVK